MSDKSTTPPTTPAAAAPSSALIEPLLLILLSIATVGTAWCSFQAAAWGGVSAGTMNQSTAASRRAVTHQLHSYQLSMVDVMLFTEYINARANSNETLAKFYSDRFRDEARTAFNAWLATRPFENPDAPPHPFMTNLYQPHLLAEAEREESEGKKLWLEAGAAGHNSRSYVFITVLLASVLFCAGTASKFQALWIRRTILIMGLAAFLFAALRLMVLPVQL